MKYVDLPGGMRGYWLDEEHPVPGEMKFRVPCRIDLQISAELVEDDEFDWKRYMALSALDKFSELILEAIEELKTGG